MSVYIGMDDTDSRSGMCTTYLVKVLVSEFQKEGLDLIGPPRLVRLNPNIPWKTRGNGAVVLRVGRGYGAKKLVGKIAGKKIYAYRYGKNISLELEDVVEKIRDYFVLEDDTTNPGIVLSERKLPEKLYWKAVREVVTIDYVEKILNEYGAKYAKFKNGRGIIGASAGIAWKARHFTYELLTYLPEDMWNEERYIDENSVIEMDKRVKSTFDNYDYENGYVAIAPHSKTPVLYGIRGTHPEDLLKAKDMIRGKQYDSWFLFLTNQGSDDHIIPRKIGKIGENENVKIRGKVKLNPRKIEGGHVILTLRDETGEIDCAAYEPTKNFRKIVENLIEGDEVEVYGSVRSEPKSVNIEKLRVLKLAEKKVKVSNPICPRCGRKMESIGRGRGYRCRKCGLKLPENAALYQTRERKIKEGWYEVPVIARRHLAKPLKIMGKSSSKIF